MPTLVESSLFISLFSVGICVSASCAGQDANFRPGASDVPPPVSSVTAATSSSALARWERFGELSSMAEIGGRLPSRGHGTGEWNAQIRGNEQAAGAMLTLRRGGAMPKGAVLVELHTDKKTGVPLDGFVMEKREEGYFPDGGDWDYAVIDQRGDVQRRGKLEFCARCHAEAAADFVFVRATPAP